MKTPNTRIVLVLFALFFVQIASWAQPCSPALSASELTPIRTGEACDGTKGNYLQRTVCNSSGYTEVAISLPAGRKASCFRIVGQRTPNTWKIVEEATGALVFSPVLPSAPRLSSVVLDGGTTGKVFILTLDPSASRPGAFITLGFVDHP